MKILVSVVKKDTLSNVMKWQPLLHHLSDTVVIFVMLQGNVDALWFMAQCKEVQ